jgi:hypothetical protein
MHELSKCNSSTVHLLDCLLELGDAMQHHVLLGRLQHQKRNMNIEKGTELPGPGGLKHHKNIMIGARKHC